MRCDMTYKLEFTEAELRIVGSALANMPYGQVFNLIYKIDSQVAKQSNGVAGEDDSESECGNS